MKWSKSMEVLRQHVKEMNTLQDTADKLNLEVIIIGEYFQKYDQLPSYKDMIPSPEYQQLMIKKYEDCMTHVRKIVEYAEVQNSTGRF